MSLGLHLLLLVGNSAQNSVSHNLYIWGDNTYGQLGNNKAPIYFSWSQISAGGNHTLGLRSDGTLWGWGQNNVGQLGDATGIDRVSPTQITFDFWKQISAGELHSAAIRADGSLWTWGSNRFGQLGNGITTTVFIPVNVSPGYSWTQVTAGSENTAAIRSDGSLWVWGLVVSLFP